MSVCREPFQLKTVLDYGSSNPDTRPSLLAMLDSQNDEQAWHDFSKLYSPIIYRYCRKKGLQEADALEVVQDVLLQVYQYISAFSYDPNRGRFRAWLQTVTYSRLCKFWKRKARRVEQDGQDEVLERQESREFFDGEFVHQVTQLALEEIESSFQAETWMAFQLTWVGQQPAEEVAEQMGRPVGWVYVAKSRVLKKLTERITFHVDHS